MALIIAHHLWTCVSVFYNLGFVNGLAFWLISHFISGFGTGYVFIQVGRAGRLAGSDAASNPAAHRTSNILSMDMHLIV